MMKDWQQYYQERTITAEKAASMVKSGDRIGFTVGRESHTIGLAIAARLGELQNVNVYVPTPGYDFGWYDPGWDESFKITCSFPLGINEQMVKERRCDVAFGSLFPFDLQYFREGMDVLLTEISSPDEKGFCSFGASLWNKKRQVQEARLVIAEVNDKLIRTYGDNYVHVSDIDYFVEHKSQSTQVMGSGSLLGKKAKKETDEGMKQMAKFVGSLIKDGDCLQIGVGRCTEQLVQLGIIDNRNDIGYQSEATVPGIIRRVREGIITGKYKTEKPGKAVITSVGGDTREEMQWVNMNPLFELVDVDYLEDIRTIASMDNMVCINQTLIVDLFGQSSAEGIGPELYSGAGGQVPFQIGALLSKGGRAITVVPSTASNDKISRIVPLLPEGTNVTIHKNLSDRIITEYGIAELRGRSQRQKAEALINVAHPKFRDELKAAAKKMFGL
ncbi:MAG: acetyl-CoA hydrolase/transferase C-terminal domain-containing protein [Dehalococcoidia bacterium]